MSIEHERIEPTLRGRAPKKPGEDAEMLLERNTTESGFAQEKPIKTSIVEFPKETLEARKEDIERTATEHDIQTWESRLYAKNLFGLSFVVGDTLTAIQDWDIRNSIQRRGKREVGVEVKAFEKNRAKAGVEAARAEQLEKEIETEKKRVARYESVAEGSPIRAMTANALRSHSEKRIAELETKRNKTVAELRARENLAGVHLDRMVIRAKEAEDVSFERVREFEDEIARVNKMREVYEESVASYQTEVGEWLEQLQMIELTFVESPAARKDPEIKKSKKEVLDRLAAARLSLNTQKLHLSDVSAYTAKIQRRYDLYRGVPETFKHQVAVAIKQHETRGMTEHEAPELLQKNHVPETPGADRLHARTEEALKLRAEQETQLQTEGEKITEPEKKEQVPVSEGGDTVQEDLEDTWERQVAPERFATSLDMLRSDEVAQNEVLKEKEEIVETAPKNFTSNKKEVYKPFTELYLQTVNRSEYARLTPETAHALLQGKKRAVNQLVKAFIVKIYGENPPSMNVTKVSFDHLFRFAMSEKKFRTTGEALLQAAVEKLKTQNKNSNQTGPDKNSNKQ